MKIYLISDTHFGHKNILKYCNRPEDFEKKIIKAFGKIESCDLLIHLGDFCMGRDNFHHDIIYRLSCKKVLVRGNHDKKSLNWYYDYWDFVCDSFSLNYFGKRILFSHIPQVPQKDLYDLNVHGHCHTNKPKPRDDRVYDYYDETYHRLLSLEEQNYQPVLLNNFIKK